MPVVDLEMHNGQPGEFPRVLAAMMRHQTGDIKITQNALRAVSLSNSLIWRPTEYSHYFFTHIPGKETFYLFRISRSLLQLVEEVINLLILFNRPSVIFVLTSGCVIR